MNKTHEMMIISLFGPPGSGKGTLAERLVNKKDFKFLSTGNLVRQHVAEKTELGALLHGYISKGELIPDEVIVRLIADWLENNAIDRVPLILDGFPRTCEQAEKFLDLIKNKFNACFRVFLIHLDDEEIIKRLELRLICENKSCQATYSKQFVSNGLCQRCGALLVQREDDAEEIVKNRLRLYAGYKDTLLGYYKEIGQVVEILDTKHLTPEQVYATFLALL